MKMTTLHRNIISIIIIIVCVNITANAKKTKHKCPIGFSLAYTKYRGDDPICYRRKGPESFTDKFKDCAGNLYTSILYSSLNITDQNVVLWTDYKSLYPGGPFIDWSYTESTGQLLYSSFEVKYEPTLGLDDDLCIVIDPVKNVTAAKCTGKHYRYCFVLPYDKEDDMERDGCRDDYWRFWSPSSTCLAAITGVNNGTVRANWRQAKEICSKRGGSLLNKGWRYANSPVLSSNPNPTFPLGIVLSPDNSSIRYDTLEDSEIPTSEWHFEKKVVSTDTSLGALRDDFWYMVNSSYIFYDVICEKPIHLRPVSLNVSVDLENKIILQANESVNDDNILCFTNSLVFRPTPVKVRYDDDRGYFVLKPIGDGYYWCVHADSKDHIVSESNKALFIREKQSLINYYAIKIHLAKQYDLEKLNDYRRDWRNKLEQYIFYRTKYVSVFGDTEVASFTEAENLLKTFKARNTGLQFRDGDLIRTINIKRLYLDRRTALVHVQLTPEMSPVPPGQWEGVQVEFMKPIYFCRGFDDIPMLSLGASYASDGCRNYSCLGDFDDGVQWVTTAIEGCTTLAPVPVTDAVRVGIGIHEFMPTMGTTMATSTISELPYIRQNISTEDSTEEETESPTTMNQTRRPKPTPFPTTTVEMTTFTETVSTVTMSTETVSTAIPTFPPVTTPVPAEEQLQQVMQDLDNLLQNESIPVMVQDLHQTFDQMETLLETEEDLDIPGELLHKLDQIATRVNLNGSGSATAIRSNIAMVLADAQPTYPVRGLRIAAREDEAFTEGAFEIITEVNETQLAMNQSEAVVQLPDSVVNSSRRISFVVFRNDRAFHSNHGTYAVNSRVLSIKVENLTHFDDGEVIDIHLSPMLGDSDRNQSRACAYWHFFDDGSGYWSQEGCTLIKSSDEGLLDTCRCDHLTHFAEVLVPRTVFSERNETALEILTIIGCCLSLFGLALVGLTAALFRAWRRDFSNKIWLQLCIAIFVLVSCFLIIVFAKFETYDIPCMLVGVALHYSVLASFCWMLVAAVLSYRRLVIVFSRDASHKLLRASAFAWGAPCAVVGVLLSVAPHSYQGQFEEKTPSGAFCYPSGLGLWLAVYLPVAIMLLANWVLFALIVRSVFASRRIQRHGDANEAIRCASVSCLLVFLFGLPWLFGLFAYNIVAAYLFTLTATFQGFVLFIFFVLGNKKTRDLWLNKLKIKQTRKVPVTSSTYTNRSTGPGYRGGPNASTIEANSSKPRSLSSPDNSRFS